MAHNQNVVRLEVAVSESSFVKGIETHRNVDGDVTLVHVGKYPPEASNEVV